MLSMTSTLPEAAAPEVRAAVAQLPAYVAGKSAQSDLTAALASNESHFPPLPSVIKAISAEADRIHRYPSMGAVEAREAIAAHFGVSPDEIAAGPGSSGVLQQIISAVCGHGDEGLRLAVLRGLPHPGGGGRSRVGAGAAAGR